MERGMFFIDPELNCIMIFEKFIDNYYWFYCVDDDCYAIYRIDQIEKLRRY
jgi:hypothetical protein